MDNKILSKYTLTEIDYKNPTNNDLLDLYDFYLDEWNEESPQFPQPTLKRYRYEFTYFREIDQNRKFILRNDNDKIVGRLVIVALKPDADAPKNKKERVEFEMRVDKSHRNEGIGKELLKFLLENLSGLDIKKISTWSNLSSGQNFCEKLGGKITMRGLCSYLDLEKNDWEKTEKVFYEMKAKNPDIKIETHFELKEEDIPEFVEIDAVFEEEISKYSEDNTFNKDFYIKEDTRHIKESLARGEKHIFSYLRNQADEVIGLSEMVIDPTNPLEIFQNITGIKKEYRRRGLAKLIKANTLLRLRDNHKPGSVISTYNDEDNTVMRKINESIGFKPIPIWKKYTFELQELREKLHEKTQNK